MTRCMIKDVQMEKIICGMIGAMRRNHEVMIMGERWELGGMPCILLGVFATKPTGLPGLMYLSGSISSQGFTWRNIKPCKNYIIEVLSSQVNIMLVDVEIWSPESIKVWFRYW